MKIILQNVNCKKLHDELIAHGTIPLLIQCYEENTYIDFEEGIDMDLVQLIINSHDPTPLPPLPTEIEKLRLEQAQSNAELFEMMLMLTGGGF